MLLSETLRAHIDRQWHRHWRVRYRLVYHSTFLVFEIRARVYTRMNRTNTCSLSMHRRCYQCPILAVGKEPVNPNGLDMACFSLASGHLFLPALTFFLEYTRYCSLCDALCLPAWLDSTCVEGWSWREDYQHVLCNWRGTIERNTRLCTCERSNQPGQAAHYHLAKLQVRIHRGPADNGRSRSATLHFRNDFYRRQCLPQDAAHLQWLV